jgi:aryl-phospho-beta-D-glucosidase BglC (GH1 family)
MTTTVRVLLLACALALAAIPAGQAAESPGVSAARFARLRRGINTSHWFAQVFDKRGYTREHFEEYITAKDIDLIRDMGFDHIRFSVNPEPMFEPAAPAALPSAYVALVDRAIDMMLERDLAVVVDIHPPDEFKVKLRDDDAHVAAFAEFWRAFARHLSRYDPERVFLEIINEPMVEDGYRWMGIQAKLAAAIREGAPRHTIVATGHRYSDLRQLLFLEPLADRNVIYNFHFYNPHLFTHQGATWGGDDWPHVKGLTYPSSEEAVEDTLATVSNAAAQKSVIRYGKERWNAALIESEIAKAAAWAKRHDVRVTCNEFGVYRRFTPPAARAAWLRDMRTALEKHGIGWAMWDYAGGFAVVNREGDGRTPDVETVAALGLKGSSTKGHE